MSEPTGLQDEDDFSHYFNATGRLRERAERAEAEIAELTTQRDLARDVAVQLEQSVAVLTAERDGEIERLQQARQDAYDEVVALKQEVARLVRERDQDAADLRAATADLKARLDSIVEEHRRRTIGTFCLSCMGACRFADDEGGE